MLILAHKQRTIDFTFDERQGIIIFEDQHEEVNPTEEFHNIFMSVALACERGKVKDEKHIKEKAIDFMENAEKYIWDHRGYKINEYKKMIRTQIPELEKKYYEGIKAANAKRKADEDERKMIEFNVMKEKEDKQKLLMAKRIIIDDIKMIKENKVVRIMEKKVEFLTDE